LPCLHAAGDIGLVRPVSGGAYVLVVCGLSFEGRIARESVPDTASAPRICCGMLAKRLAAAAGPDCAGPDCAGIVSFGIAGGLDPALPAGTLVVASSVIGPNGIWPTDEKWSRQLLALCPGAVHGAILGVVAPLRTVPAKQDRFRETCARAVDMESHVAAAFAAEKDLPFAALRAIADPAGRAVPGFALHAMRPDGALAPLAVMKMLLRKPHELPAVLSLAGDVFSAARSLASARRGLGPGFGLDLR
jgi:hopanoid-associated phosphorylase